MAKSMFSSSMYDVQQDEIDQANESAYKTAQLGGYGAYSQLMGQAGAGLGRGLRGMMGGQSIAAAKQGKIDELMKKYPKPETRQDFMNIADEFRKAGLMQEYQVAFERANSIEAPKEVKAVKRERVEQDGVWYWADTGKPILDQSSIPTKPDKDKTPQQQADAIIFKSMMAENPNDPTAAAKKFSKHMKGAKAEKPTHLKIGDDHYWITGPQAGQTVADSLKIDRDAKPGALVPKGQYADRMNVASFGAECNWQKGDLACFERTFAIASTLQDNEALKANQKAVVAYSVAAGERTAKLRGQLNETYQQKAWLDNGVQTGWGSDTFMGIKRALGIDVSTQEAFLASTRQGNLADLSLMSGAVSDKDIEVVQQANTRLGNSIEGNLMIIKVKQLYIKNHLKQEAHISRWLKDHKNASYVELQIEQEEWANRNPLGLATKDEFKEFRTGRYTTMSTADSNAQAVSDVKNKYTSRAAEMLTGLEATYGGQ